MTMDREKEIRERELESAMYTNCLLLGLDPSIIGVRANNGTPRLGLFQHSNREQGEQLLYFILSSLRGPKDFDKVWPIFNSSRSSRDFLKVVQNIISELESQGAIPRCNSRVSSLATCCGPRFVELLWQLSFHALREVHKRTYADDVVASLTDVSFSHASTLIPVTKARIALERRRFLKNAETAFQKQAMWSNLAHEMTSEYRFLSAEEAYLQQELDKLHEDVSSSSQNFHLVQRATQLWDSLLSCQHEDLASGPIEDLLAHREHRYRISGSSLLAAMDESTQSSYLDKEQERSRVKVNRETVMENSTSFQPTVDIAQVLRRWTHALQCIHKQLLHLAKANDGEGPDLLRSASGGGTSGHAESLVTTLAEHRQYLASMQVLVNQLKDVAPTIENSISELSKEFNSSSVQPQSTGRKRESSSDERHFFNGSG